MAIIIKNETKTVVQSTYDRCYKIEINSILDPVTKSKKETTTMYYERIVEIDGAIVSKENKYTKEYLSSYLTNIKWTSPWNKQITGLDVMAFIQWFNDNYTEALKQIEQPTI